MSHIRLDAMSVTLSNMSVKDNDIHVNFEYEKLSEKEIKIFLDTYVGKDRESFRFLLRVIYEVTLD